MPTSSDDVEQLRQDHPGAAAHLPDLHPDAGPEDLTSQLLRQRRAALTRLRLADRGLPPGMTANQLAAAVRADLTDGHPAVWPAPTSELASGNRQRTLGLLRAAWLESTDWRTTAERLARLLVRDRMALARVKTQRDERPVPDLEQRHRRARARELTYEADFPLRDEYGFAASDAHVDVVVAAVLAHPGDAAAAARRFGLELLSNPLATRDGVPTDEGYELGIAIAVLPLAVERAHTLDSSGGAS